MAYFRKCGCKYAARGVLIKKCIHHANIEKHVMKRIPAKEIPCLGPLQPPHTLYSTGAGHRICDRCKSTDIYENSMMGEHSIGPFSKVPRG